VRIKRMGAPDLPLPRYETDGAAGMDLRADLTMPVKLPLGAEVEQAHAEPGGPSVRHRTLRIHPGARVKVPCGFAFHIPEGFEGSVRGRSGWMLQGLYAHGTVDSDYRGGVFVLLENRGVETLRIEHATRVAQMIVAPAQQARLELTTELSPTARGDGGFCSTGTR
jgi:dUTP pyrophosphatase